MRKVTSSYTGWIKTSALWTHVRKAVFTIRKMRRKVHRGCATDPLITVSSQRLAPNQYGISR